MVHHWIDLWIRIHTQHHASLSSEWVFLVYCLRHCYNHYARLSRQRPFLKGATINDTLLLPTLVHLRVHHPSVSKYSKAPLRKLALIRMVMLACAYILILRSIPLTSTISHARGHAWPLAGQISFIIFQDCCKEVCQ